MNQKTTKGVSFGISVNSRGEVLQYMNTEILLRQTEVGTLCVSFANQLSKARSILKRTLKQLQSAIQEE